MFDQTSSVSNCCKLYTQTRAAAGRGSAADVAVDVEAALGVVAHVLLEERLRDTHLLRVHKSYLANMDKVQEVIPWFKGTYWLKMLDGQNIEIPVSKSQIKEIKTILGLK